MRITSFENKVNSNDVSSLNNQAFERLVVENLTTDIFSHTSFVIPSTQFKVENEMDQMASCLDISPTAWSAAESNNCTSPPAGERNVLP